MALDDKANVGHKHTTSDIRGGRINEGTLPSTIIPSIEAAQGTADTAVASADGKNTITWSANAANGSGIKAGDTWFQTASGLIVGQWEWSGSAWTVHTIDSLLIANLDAGKITTGTLAAGQTITAGDPEGSRIELDSAGLRKYATDGTTVQVDLTGETAEFSGLITGSEIVGGVLKTAASGARVVIEPEAVAGGVIRFYSGIANETYPAEIWGFASGITGNVAIASPEITDRQIANVILTTSDESEIGLLADFVYANASRVYTNVSALETAHSWATLDNFLVRRIFVVANVTARAALVANYVAAPYNQVIDLTHPLFVWQADAAVGAQFQYTADGTTWTAIGGGGGGTPASETVAGIVELATPAEAVTGTDTARAVTPAGVAAAFASGGADSGWTAVTFSSGYEDYSASFPCQVRKIGKAVYSRGLVKRSAGAWAASTAYNPVFTVPAGYRPAGQLLIFSVAAAVGNVAGSPGNLILDPAGAAEIRTAPTGTPAYISLSGLTWPVD